MIITILAKKVRLRPTKEQEHQLWRSAGTARWAYNWALAKQEESYQNGGKFIQDGDLRKELTVLKQTGEYSWLYNVSNDATKQAIKDACDAYKRFFKRLSEKPQFKSKKRSKPSFYNDNVQLRVEASTVLIAKVGWVKTSEQVPMNVKYSNPRISFDGKYWYLSVGIEDSNEPTELTDVSLGIDIGVKDLAICSDGQVFRNINKTKVVKRTEKRLRRLQRKVSRKYEMNKKGSQFVKTNNITKIERKIKHLHRRLSNIRSDHTHQATNAIVKNKPGRVVMETLNIKGMMKNKHLSKAIAKQGLYEFKRQMKYKCEKHGIELIEADQWYPSSKTCSCCGKVKKDLKLSERTYRCECGLSIDRDLNAAINLAHYMVD